MECVVENAVVGVLYSGVGQNGSNVAVDRKIHTPRREQSERLVGLFVGDSHEYPPLHVSARFGGGEAVEDLC